ncbi:MAG: 2-oxoacid:ferredoxin oxidoreductase subunit gamma [Anaerolineae bacterium]|nr:2-oxoacid:ferredoxin oxidoreductase subunit gamma [Anaerolineae bacterium]
MQEEVIFAGFGGQGVLFAGQLLAYTAMDEGKHVTWIPSYGPEMRGGTANCTVVVSNEPIGSPLVSRPSIAVVFNNPSMLKYCDQVKPGGLLVVNISIVEATTSREDITILNIPATETANALGETRLTNMILMGAMLAARPVVSVETLRQTIIARLPKRRQDLLALNLEAITKGMELAEAQLVARA